MKDSIYSAMVVSEVIHKLFKAITPMMVLIILLKIISFGSFWIISPIVLFIGICGLIQEFEAYEWFLYLLGSDKS